jgi:hypothetical protein
VTGVTARRRTSTLVVVAAVIVVVLVAGGAALLMTRNTPTTPAPVPTPFNGAYTVQRARYTISVPDDWAFSDLSNDSETIHIWQWDNKAYIALWLLEKTALPGIKPDTEFSVVVDTFEQQVERGQTALHFLDSAIADDGSIRRSYRFDGMEDSAFPQGQTDNFYLDRGRYVALVQMYSAYGTGNDLVPLFQSVLDSVRVNQA